MKSDKDSRILYQNTFNEVHASEHLLRKVEAMKHHNKILKKNISKGMIAAASFGILVFSNVISYASSGSPWILTITLPDGEMRQIEMEAGPGDRQVIDNESSPDCVSSEHATSTEADITLEASEDDIAYVHRLETVNEQVYLILDEQYRVDITDEFRSGVCKGTFDADGITWCYEVTGTPEDYEIQVYLVTYNER